MGRGVRSVLGVAFVAVVLAAVPVAAGAAPRASAAPPKGTLTCDLAGEGTFSPALPSTAQPDGAVSSLKFKLKGVLSTCDSSGVTGGKLPITTGIVQFTATLDAGSGCQDIADFGSPDLTTNVAKLGVKLTGTLANGKHPKVASLAVKSDGFSNDGTIAGWDIQSDTFPSTKANAAFPDESAALHLVFDSTTIQNEALCEAGRSDLDKVVFGGHDPSRFGTDSSTLTIS